MVPSPLPWESGLDGSAGDEGEPVLQAEKGRFEEAVGERGKSYGDTQADEAPQEDGQGVSFADHPELGYQPERQQMQHVEAIGDLAEIEERRWHVPGAGAEKGKEDSQDSDEDQAIVDEWRCATEPVWRRPRTELPVAEKPEH